MNNNSYRDTYIPKNLNSKQFYRIMKLTYLFLFLCTFSLLASEAKAQTEKVTIQANGMTINQLLKAIEKQTNYLFVYSKAEVDLNQKVNLSVKDQVVSEVLKKVFNGTSIKYAMHDENIVLSKADAPLPQQSTMTVKGIVKDVTGEPLIGVTVMIAGNASKGTVTDINGAFTIPNVPADSKVSVSYIGYKTETLSARSNMNIVLKEDSQTLDEVVVVGYGTQKKINLTGSVSQVTEKAFESRPVQNVSQALQGMVPGMNFSVGANGGKLNNAPSVSIRGAGTIGAGSNAAPLILIDGVEGNMNLLNPQDIESISILKDAASSSIYGSRAPFGVILITTKQGKTGKTAVSYTNNFRFNSPINQPETMDSYHFANYFNTARINASESPVFSQTTIDNIIARNNGEVGIIIPFSTANNKFSYTSANGDTDWYKVHYKDRVMSQEHSISVSGGSDRLSYYLSGNFMDQEGLLRFADESYYRYSMSGKVNAKVNKYINISYNTKWFRTNYGAPSYLNGLFFHNVLRKWPNMVAFDPNGHYADNSEIIHLQDGGRVNEEVEQNYQQLQVDITPLKGWNIHLQGNIRTNTNFTHTDIQAIYGHEIDGTPYEMELSNSYTPGQSRVKESTSKSQFYTTNLYSDYTHQFGDHYFKVLAGFNAELQKSRSLSGQRDGIIVPGLPTIDTSSAEDKTSGGYSHWATAGFFGRLNYNYKERYMLEVNGRYDGTSRFLRDQRWNIFPSFSAGWNIAREDFWKPLENVVNLFKFKTSWGELGNQNTKLLYPFFETLPVQSNKGLWLVNGKMTNTADIAPLVSTLLTWERVRTFNIGIDFGAFSNRLTGTIEYFKRKTVDMVGPAPELPSTLGIKVPNINNADMQSAGFDFEISWRDRIGKVDYGVKFNLSDAKQKILRYPNTTNAIGNWYAGKMNGELWGYTTIGIAKTKEEMDNHIASLPNGGQNKMGGTWGAGDIMYADINGDGKIDAGQSSLSDPGDRKIIGNSTPRYNYGFILDAAYQGFDFSVFFQGVGKRDYMPGNGQQGAMFWGVVNNLYQSVGLKQHFDYYRPEGDPMGANLNAYYPRPDFSTSKNQVAQTKYLQDASYIRLKNAQIGYTLSKQWTSKLRINKCRIYISGDNLWTGTNLAEMFDPETLTGADNWGQGKTYPLSRVFSFGVNINM